MTRISALTISKDYRKWEFFHVLLSFLEEAEENPEIWKKCSFILILEDGEYGPVPIEDWIYDGNTWSFLFPLTQFDREVVIRRLVIMLPNGMCLNHHSLGRICVGVDNKFAYTYKFEHCFNEFWNNRESPINK